MTRRKIAVVAVVAPLQETYSTAVVPVYGNQAGDRCYNPAGYRYSFCNQGYRWNLDHVVDPRGNTMTYFYDKWVGAYANNNGSNNSKANYDVAVTLNHIDYGTRSDDPVTAKAPVQVWFDRTQRCSDPQPAACLNYPDAPYDQWCDPGWSSCGGNTSPTFWTPLRLASVRTQVLKSDNATYQPVDRWDLGATFPATPDGASPAMWLDSVTHTGQVGGSAAEPTMRFAGGYLANRVENGVPKLHRLRLGGVTNGAGGQTVIYYSSLDPATNPQACTPTTLPNPDQNNKLCFPQYFTPGGGQPGWGWFHKYLATAVKEIDLTGGTPDEWSNYEYSMYGATNANKWHHDDNELVPVARRSWTDWRGYSHVNTRHGITGGQQTISQKLFYLGMHGDRTDAGDNTRQARIEDSQHVFVYDQRQYRGQLREEIVLDNGVIQSSTIHDPASVQTAQRSEPWQGGVWTAYRVHEQATNVRTRVAGAYRHTRTEYVYDSYNLVTVVKDLGDMAIGTDNVCTYTSYARDDTRMLINYPSQTITTDCVGGPTPAPANHLAASHTLYDNTTTVGAAPTKGLATKTRVLAWFSGTTPVWKQTERAAHDKYGRPVTAYDALNRKTTTAYTPTSGGPITQTRVTNPLGHATTATVDPAWGAPTRVVDPNGKTTVADYDPLGRLTDIWLPGRTTAQTPNVRHAYTLRDTAANSVTTTKLGPNNDNQIVSYEIFDGRFRLRQTQTPGPQTNGGRVISDIQYDGRGLKTVESTFWNATAPSDTRLVFNNTSAPAQHRFTYDAVGRQSTDGLYVSGVLKWQTATSYDGDRVTVTPPAGGTATTAVTNARGKTTALLQYLGATPTGAYQSTTYAYDRLSRQTLVTDPNGNEWSTTYDLRGRTTKAIDPDEGATTMSYDDAGQMLSNTDARGGTVSYTYDTLGRKTTAWHGAVTTGAKIADWGYDSLAKGHLSFSRRYAEGSTSVYYTTAVTGYDERYRPLGTRVTIPAVEGALAGTYTTSNAYNVDGSVKSSTYPAAGTLAAETVNYTYDNTGLAKTAVGQNSYVVGTSHYGFGAVYQRVLLGSSQPARITTIVDQATRRMTRTKTETRSPTNTSVWNEALTENYTYDPAGNIKAIAETAAGVTVANQCFSYDGLRQLTEAWTTTATACQSSPSTPVIGGTDPYWTSYRYDTIGNRTQDIRHNGASNTIRTYNYPGGSQPHTLASVTTTVTGNPTPIGTDTFTYDTAGNTKTRNLAGKPGQTLTWDVEGRLTKLVDSNGVTTSYIYDAEGNRLIAKDSTGTTLYLAGTQLHINTGGGLDVTRYYTCGGTTVAVRVNTTLSFQVTDHHGTAQLSINASTLAVTRRKYDPFGNPRGTQPPWPTPHGYIDGLADPTGLTHLGAREYDPTTGRFLTVDPIFDPADPQQMNNYAYANNSPITNSDPTGLEPCECNWDPIWGPPAPPPQGDLNTGGDDSWAPRPPPQGDLNTGGDDSWAPRPPQGDLNTGGNGGGGQSEEPTRSNDDDCSPCYGMAKGGKNRHLETDLIGKSEQELDDMYKAATGKERERIKRHQKAMGYRHHGNKDSRKANFIDLTPTQQKVLFWAVVTVVVIIAAPQIFVGLGILSFAGA